MSYLEWIHFLQNIFDVVLSRYNYWMLETCTETVLLKSDKLQSERLKKSCKWPEWKVVSTLLEIMYASPKLVCANWTWKLDRGQLLKKFWIIDKLMNSITNFNTISPGPDLNDLKTCLKNIIIRSIFWIWYSLFRITI